MLERGDSLSEEELRKPTDGRRLRRANGAGKPKPKTGRLANRVVTVLEAYVRYRIWRYAEARGVTMGTEGAMLILEGLKARGHTESKMLAEWLKYKEKCEETGEVNLFPGKVGL